MLKLRKVAITGGLSCGKSSVCHFLKELGAQVISADEIVHQLLSTDETIGQKVVELLGTRILKNKKIDKAEIAKIVFQDPHLLQELETLLHPTVYKEINKQYAQNENTLFFAEVPLLFESGGEKEFDITVAVIANPELCLQRYGSNKNQFEARSSRQLPQLEKAKRADYVIMNSGSLETLKSKTKELYEELSNLNP